MTVLHKALLLAHAVAAAVLVGASTHLALQSLAAIRGRARPALLRIYPPVAFLAWAATFALGALLYPHYRVAVRYEWLDVYAVWASVLFDVKENVAVFAGALLAVAWRTCTDVVGARDPSLARWFAAACCAACAIAWWDALSGLLIASVRSV